MIQLKRRFSAINRASRNTYHINVFTDSPLLIYINLSTFTFLLRFPLVLLTVTLLYGIGYNEEALTVYPLNAVPMLLLLGSPYENILMRHLKFALLPDLTSG